MANTVDYRYKELVKHFKLPKADMENVKAFKQQSLIDIKNALKVLYNADGTLPESRQKKAALSVAILLEHTGKVENDRYVASLSQLQRTAVLGALLLNHLKSAALQQLVRTAPNDTDKEKLVNLLTAETAKAKMMNRLESGDILQRLDALAALSASGDLDKKSPAVSSLHAAYVKEVIVRHADKEKNPLSIGILVVSMQYLQSADRVNVVDLMARELRTSDLPDIPGNAFVTIEERTKIIAGVVERSNLKKVHNETIMHALKEGLLDKATSDLIFTKKGREFAKDAEHIGGMLEAVSSSQSRINVCGKNAIGTMLKKVGNSDFHKAVVLLSNSEKLVGGNLRDAFSVIPTERLSKAFGYTKFLNDVNMEQMRDGIIAASNKEMAAALFKKLDDKGMYDKLEVLLQKGFFQDIAKEQIKTGKMSVAAFEHLLFRGAIEVEISDIQTKQGGGLTRVGKKYNNRLFVNEHIDTDQVSRSEKFRYDMIFNQGRAPGVIERIKNRLSGKSTQMFPSDRGEEYDYVFTAPKPEATTATRSAPGMRDDSGVTGDTASDRTVAAVRVASALNATRATKPVAPPLPSRPGRPAPTAPVTITSVLSAEQKQKRSWFREFGISPKKEHTRQDVLYAIKQQIYSNTLTKERVLNGSMRIEGVTIDSLNAVLNSLMSSAEQYTKTLPVNERDSFRREFLDYKAQMDAYLGTIRQANAPEVTASAPAASRESVSKPPQSQNRDLMSAIQGGVNLRAIKRSEEHKDSKSHPLLEEIRGENRGKLKHVETNKPREEEEKKQTVLAQALKKRFVALNGEKEKKTAWKDILEKADGKKGELEKLKAKYTDKLNNEDVWDEEVNPVKKNKWTKRIEDLDKAIKKADKGSGPDSSSRG